MDVRQSIHSDHAKTLDTAGLRKEFLKKFSWLMSTP